MFPQINSSKRFIKRKANGASPMLGHKNEPPDGRTGNVFLRNGNLEWFSKACNG